MIHLPHDLTGLAVQFVRALATRTPVRLVVDRVGDDHMAAINTVRIVADPTVTCPSCSCRSTSMSPTCRQRVGASPSPIRVVSTTDADDEVRQATRAVLDAARSGVAFERIAVLWPTQRPYARLVEHHLTAAGIPWNGRPGTAVAERLAPRLVLDLLDIDRRGLRRHGFFSLVADVPPSDADGAFWPTAAWERASRQAGVARDDDWNVRLGPLVGSDRWGDSAESLLAFVTEPRDRRSATRAAVDRGASGRSGASTSSTGGSVRRGSNGCPRSSTARGRRSRPRSIVSATSIPSEIR